MSLLTRWYKWRNRPRLIAQINVKQSPKNPCQITVQMVRRLPNGMWGDGESAGYTGAVEDLPAEAGARAMRYLKQRLNAGMDQTRPNPY